MRHLPYILVLFSALAVGGNASAKQPEDPELDEEAELDEGDGNAPAEGEEGAGSTETEDESGAASAPVDDLESLRAEYFKLRDRLFQSRARASAVASALYSTRLSVKLNYDSSRYYTVTRTTIRLDGANVFDDTEGVIASDKAPRFEGYIAPGRHQLSIRIEATGKDDDRFTSVIENSFVVQATKGKDLSVSVSAEDGGNMAYNWSKKERGSYKLHLDVSVKSTKRGKKDSQHIKRTGELRQHGPASKRRG